MSKNKVIREIHVPRAEKVREDGNKKVLIQWIDKVEKAKVAGSTYCFVVSSFGGISKYVVQKFLDAGYDIYYTHFRFNGSWSVKAHWEDGCCGRIYNEDGREYVDIETMFAY